MKHFVNYLLLTMLCVSFAPTQSPAQDTLVLHLKDCRTTAREAHPLTNQNANYKSVMQLNVKNLIANYLPTLNLNAQATYQSDVLTFDIDIPIPGFEFPQPDADQYKVYLEIQQIIWDGGATKASKDIEKSNLDIQQQTTEVELSKIDEMVNTFFFALLSLDQTQHLLRLAHEDLSLQMKSVAAAVDNGVLTGSNMDMLQAELLKLEQNQLDLAQKRRAAQRALQILRNDTLQQNYKVSAPDFETITNKNIERPEFRLLDLQSDKLNAIKTLQSKTRMPRVAAFAQFGYGKPGLNMMQNEFTDYYIVGASLNWNIWDWQKTKRNKQIISHQQENIEMQKQSLEQKFVIQAESLSIEIEHYNELIDKDIKIIELRRNIKNTAASQLRNGIISTTEYLKEANTYLQAQINLELHKIQKIKAQADYLIVLGQL